MAEQLVHGIGLDVFAEPIQTALRAYSDQAAARNVALHFDPIAASTLELTPDKPNSARSMTPVQYQDRRIGDLYTIAFAPFDGTGDEGTYQLTDMTASDKQQPVGFDEYLGFWHTPDASMVPRSKAAVSTELWLPLAAMDGNTGDIALFAGMLDVLGITQVGSRSEISLIGRLGPAAEVFHGAIREGRAARLLPRAERTTSYYQNGDRFGDPHALYNRMSAVQVCGFLALTSGVERDHPDLVKDLRAPAFTRCQAVGNFERPAELASPDGA